LGSFLLSDIELHAEKHEQYECDPESDASNAGPVHLLPLKLKHLLKQREIFVRSDAAELSDELFDRKKCAVSLPYLGVGVNDAVPKHFLELPVEKRALVEPALMVEKYRRVFLLI
jgi:hypothetical protein